MVTGYNLIWGRIGDKFDEYIKIGETHLNEQKVKVAKPLKEYVINGIADGTSIQKEWFPQIEADIFISHSHADERLAKGLAGWLYITFGLKCFIDACVWGYSDELLEEINTKYSNKRKDTDGGYLYDHKKCNTASKHVNTMLTIALHRMIDKAEVTFLLNTSNAISKYENVYNDATYSPWIYSEIVCTEIVRKKQISEYRDEVLLEHNLGKSFARNDGFSAAYKISLEHLETLSYEELLLWKNKYDRCKITYPLDYLYKLTYSNETKNILINSAFL